MPTLLHAFVPCSNRDHNHDSHGTEPGVWKPNFPGQNFISLSLGSNAPMCIGEDRRGDSQLPLPVDGDFASKCGLYGPFQ
jgi:hypothetical protein